MAIISFDKDAVVDYVPDVGSNREDDDPCVVGIRFVPHSRVQSYTRQIAAKLKGSNNVKKLTEISEHIQKKQFVENVDYVARFVASDGSEITDVGEFYDCADKELIEDIIKAMESSQRLSEGQRKNS